MTFTAMIVFGASLLCILLLFIIKRIEVGREKRFAENLRARADSGALLLKHLLAEAERHAAETPWFLATLARWGVHVGALSFARLARKSALYAHQLADFVSHKRGFERTETRSRYLKEVSEYKNGNDTPVARE